MTPAVAGPLLDYSFARIPIHDPGTIEVSEFSARPHSLGAAMEADKSTGRLREKQDQSASLSSLAIDGTGLDITVNAVGVTSSLDYPDGFRWTQTVTTNDPGYTPVGAPLVDPPVTYVDPAPNDDAKPFYWTDTEEAAHVAEFKDTPHRPANAAGTAHWNAILSLNGVKGQEVTRFDSLTYGFSVETNGKVSQRGPATPANLSEHQAQLRTEFPGWTFK